jgi:acetoacetyl-CoA synthetase
MSKPLWEPSAARIKQANLTRFIEFVNQRYDQNFKGYAELYQWSVTRIPDFWAAIWEFGGVKASRPYTQVVDNPAKMPGAKWFSGARLNFAENLLRYRDVYPALVFTGENGGQTRMTYAELYDAVAKTAAGLREVGVTIGDRVAGFMPNMGQTVVAMLAATSIGAIWSSCSPDFGFQGVMDRFGQIEPKVLFSANGYFYNGKSHDSLGRVKEVMNAIPSIKRVVIVPYTTENPDLGGLRDAVGWHDFVDGREESEIDFEQLPFDHPIYIMYSSGTTGVPKCIVHGAGGTLIQHLKELWLHTDLKREDRIFYFTTCGWMMWNWLVSSLTAGATLMLYDGSPFIPEPGSLWQLAQDEKFTVFGTSARYLAAVEKAGVSPGRAFDLSSIRTILSTGSPLSVESFHFVYEQIKPDVQLASISGGTDIISCFALGNPIGPVHAGQLQCRGLGMAVEAYDFEGKPVVGEKGELVCVKAAPSMPIYFWSDPDGQKYHDAYFDVFPGVWHHGDFIEITDTGGVIIYGRSDATLNPGGVRIGTAEIYRQVENLEEIADSLVVGQNWEGDVRVVLFVRLQPGVEFNEDLIKKIKTTIRQNTTPRHVPAKIIPVADIPYTISGKKVEMAVGKVIHGQEVKNKDALANPQALDLYADLAELKS